MTTDLAANFGRYQGIRMSSCRDMAFPGFMAWNAINDFVDMNNRTSNLLDGEFILFLEQMQRLFPTAEGITDEWDVRNNLRYNSINRHLLGDQFWRGSPGGMCHMSWDNVFFISNEFLLPIGAITPFTVPLYFEGFTPLVDRQGRMRSNMNVTYPWKMVSIPTGSNDLLAWEFVTQHLIPASLCYRTNREMFWAIPGVVHVRTNLGGSSFDSPIMRDLTESHFTDIFERSIEMLWIGIEGNVSTMLRGLPLAGTRDASYAEREQTISDAIRRIEDINNAPISPVPLIPFDLFEPTIHLMLRRMILPEDAAQRIHDAVSEWLTAS